MTCALGTHTCPSPHGPTSWVLDSWSQLRGRTQDPSGFCKRLSLTSFTRWQQTPDTFFSESSTVSLRACRSKSQKVKEGWRKWWINHGWVLENSEMALTVQGSRIPTRGRDVGLSSALLGLSMVDSPAGTWSQPTVFWDFFSPGISVPAQFSQQTSAGGPVQYCLYRLALHLKGICANWEEL